ncbi:MAG: VCBS repeat-containing protein [Vicinamibacteria bacterium]|nr:VCBS repeat-containing protein [Vicinamibacteria bacterium]
MKRPNGVCSGMMILSVVVVMTGGGCRPKPEPAQTPSPGGPPQAVQQPLDGGPYPSIVLAQAWFYKDAQGATKPGSARLEIWRQSPKGWHSTRLEDADSNVFHKVLLREGGIVTIGAEQAMLKKWRWDGKAWSNETLWSRKWGGRFNRLRDVEVGDVDGDGREEYVIATHDSGVIAIVHPPVNDEPARVVELNERPDTFVHEIEIGDIDGDGKLEFFATPSERNRVGVSQAGQVVMYRWDGSSYQRTIVDSLESRHAKEILVSDLDGDGRDELLAVFEAELGEGGRIIRPVEIRQYNPLKDGSFSRRILATIDDAQCRFLVSGDFDQDGEIEIVAAAIKAGLFLLKSRPESAKNQRTWSVARFETQSSGYEHAALAADLDQDGTLELYVAADDQGELNRYVWNKTSGSFDKTHLFLIEKSGFTWNIAAGRL